MEERKKQFTTGSGIPLKSVYTHEDVTRIRPEDTLGLPGEPPFTRGIYPNMYRSKLWTIRQFTGFATPEAGWRDAPREAQGDCPERFFRNDEPEQSKAVPMPRSTAVAGSGTTR